MQMKARALSFLILAVLLMTGCIEVTLVEQEPDNKLVEFALVTHTPSQQISTTATPTLNESPTPTHDSAPTNSGTAIITVSPSQTPSPTSTATATQAQPPTPSPSDVPDTSTPEPPTPWPSPVPSPTHTPTPRRPTATPTPRWFPSPILIEPYAGMRFVGRDANIRLSWRGAGQLEDDEFYVVSIPHPWGVEHGWTKQTFWRVPSYLYDLAPPSRELAWRVRVERFLGTATPKPDEGGVPAGEYSIIGSFFWDTSPFDSPIPPPGP